MEQPIRIILVDDHAIMRDGLRQILSVASSMQVVAEASCGADAIKAVTELGCDVLLLDVSLPDMSGINVLRTLKKADCLPNTLMLSMHKQPQFVDEAIRTGAMGYLTKDVDSDYLFYAIRRVAKGERVDTPMKVEGVSSPASSLSLSARERQIFDLLAAGNGVCQIAEHLFISPKTVSTHKTRIMEKLGVKSDAELFKHAVIL